MNVLREQFIGNIKPLVNQIQISLAIEQSKIKIEESIKAGKVLTACLYHYKNTLFFYVERLCQNTDGTTQKESEDRQMHHWFLALYDYMEETTCYQQLHGFLQKKGAIWTKMHPVFYHAYPKDSSDWQRVIKPSMQRGRIALLKEDKIINYIYHHKALTLEGHLVGDRYQFISIYDNILFSYFEEPKTLTNCCGDITLKSEAIEHWLNEDPGSHFLNIEKDVHSHFTFIPAYFILNQCEYKES